MARGNSKLGRRGRGREVVEETGPGIAWSADGVATPAAPSPGRNILPGEPFEPVAPVFPAQRNPEPAPFAATAPAGWGFAAAPGIPAGMPGAQPQPGLVPGDGTTLNWPGEEPTGPMPAVPAAGPDPLDALQQYAGLPLGTAPAPDPTQLYHPSQLTAPLPLYGEGTPGQAPAAAAPPVSPASESGFADGGIFTGSEPFDGIPAAAPLAPPAHDLPGAFGPQVPTAGYVPQSSLEPLDVTPVVPLIESLPGDDGGRRPGRRRAGGRRRDGAQFDDGSGPAGRGAKRAVALLGAVAVLGAAGYVGYSQLSGTDEAVSSPTVPAKAAPSAHYELPEHLANLVQITPAQSKALTANYIKLAAKTSPGLPAAQTATAYHPPGSPKVAVNVVVFRPTSTSTYDALLGSLSRPAPGSASVAAVPVAAGAAGGTMMCGSQRGAQAAAWCAWNSSKGMGFVQAKGTANTAFAAVYTRELRAYAER